MTHEYEITIVKDHPMISEDSMEGVLLCNFLSDPGFVTGLWNCLRMTAIKSSVLTKSQARSISVTAFKSALPPATRHRNATA